MLYTISLKDNRSFRRLYSSGKSAVSPYMAIYVKKNRLGTNRLGMTVSKKIGCAVVRNRTRRRLKEIYRTHEAAFRSGYDIVVVARSRAVGADFALLTKNFLGCAGKLGLLKKEL